jgi:nuclear pore complex protein Nup98-Nup96
MVKKKQVFFTGAKNEKKLNVYLFDRRYNCLPVHSIHDALNLYEHNVSLGYCKKPLPPYLEDNVGTEENPKDDKLTIKLTSNSNIYDTCYHLIKLFCDKTHSINDIIAPECHSNNLLDFRLS